ncbi:unnamed protein product [Brachionus calyciflorus]|uniref:Uncharacterized protein n=1 Tax=Brachionus calyciflorus TaxID=104777 RepID=A0A813WBC9_9BILA|nr:unnamed protein product [Brachionus calyciflorus]
MSKSTQLKRKKLDRVSNEYESDGETFHRPNKSIRSNSLRLGNDLESNEDGEDSGIYLLIQFIYKPDQFYIVPDKTVTLNQNDSSLGFVKNYLKLYKVKIIKKGTQKFVMRKAERFKFNLSLKTSDENETENQLNRRC